MDNETKAELTIAAISIGIVSLIVLALYLATSGPSSYGLPGN